MIIMGIDPGTAKLGWAVVESTSAYAYGCITSNQTAPELRLSAIYKELNRLIKKYKPDVIAIEELFFAVNAKTVIPVAEARGIALLCAAQAKIPVSGYTPLVVKQTITGNGKADKRQMQKMVQILLKLPEIPKPDDAADALAVALTHAYTKKFV